MKLIVLLLSGCIAYNEQCLPPASEPIAELRRSLDLRSVSTGEAVAGNLVADAVLAQTIGATIAVVPSVAFSRSDVCSERAFVERGVLTQDSIEALLPSEDTIVLLRVTSDDVKRILEHSVARLPAASEAFLHVANILFSVDCAEAPQTLANGDISFPGARVSSLFIGGAAAAPGQMFQLATTSSIASLGFVDLSRAPVLLDTRRRVSDAVIEYARERSPLTPDLEGRVSLRDTCQE